MTTRRIIYYRLQPVYEEQGEFLATAALVHDMVTGEPLDGMNGPCDALSVRTVAYLKEVADKWNDRDDDFSVSIAAAHPISPSNKDDDDRWDRNLRARTLVNNRHSKSALIDVIHWLLTRAERAEKALKEIADLTDACLSENDEADTIRVAGCKPLQGEVADAVIAFVRKITVQVRLGMGWPNRAPKSEAA